jgi:signal peptidase I
VDASGAGAATGLRVGWGTCENCRFETRLDDVPSSGGDRIYTMKSGLHLPFLPSAGRVGPQRWEVAVFKLPEEPEVRYIKRMVGLPGETIRIGQGDLWRRGGGDSGPFQRLRRPLQHQLATQVLVYDDAHRAASLRENARWNRWSAPSGGWSGHEDRRDNRYAPGQCSSTWPAAQKSWLGRLADELVKWLRPHPLGQRRIGLESVLLVVRDGEEAHRFIAGRRAVPRDSRASFGPGTR